MIATCPITREGKKCGGEITAIIGTFTYSCENETCQRKYSHDEVVWMLKQKEKRSRR